MYRALTLTAMLALGALTQPRSPADTPKPADPPKSGSGVLNPKADSLLRPVGQIVVKLAKADSTSVAVKVPEVEQKGSRRGRAHLQRAEKDQSYDLAADAQVRWHDLPRKADGSSYSTAEYQKLRDPPGTPGYKADASDLKPGQTVRLYLARAGKDDPPVVTVVMILADAPKQSEKAKKNQ